MIEHFQRSLREILQSVIGLSDDRHGYSEEEIAAAEQRLGVALPPPLRFMYRYVGRHAVWSDAMHSLVKPAELEFEDDDKLVILDEVQAVVEEILLRKDLGLENPPVYQRPLDEEELYEEPHKLAQFLLESLVWELISLGEDLEENEGLAVESFFGEQMTEERAREEVRGLTRVALDNDDADQWCDAAYYGKRAVAFIFVKDEVATIYSWNLWDGEEED